MQEVKLICKLYRLVSYKIDQIKILEQNVCNSEDLKRLESSINREGQYSKSIKKIISLNSYEKTMWRYYLLLETLFLANINKHHCDVKDQMLINEIQQKINY
ncbi:MAG: hypothetical protein OEV78_03610 [Spirochaetia bacterium]|nr:hypothetical protein [Spirochaetia bacterium]